MFGSVCMRKHELPHVYLLLSNDTQKKGIFVSCKGKCHNIGKEKEYIFIAKVIKICSFYISLRHSFHLYLSPHLLVIVVIDKKDKIL